MMATDPLTDAEVNALVRDIVGKIKGKCPTFTWRGIVWEEYQAKALRGIIMDAEGRTLLSLFPLCTIPTHAPDCECARLTRGD